MNNEQLTISKEQKPRTKIHSLLLIVTCYLLSVTYSCVNQYKVVVGFSPVLREHYIEYPTIEVDIIAATDGEVDEIKEMGVEEYFMPGSGVRDKMQAQTCFFYREERHTFVLPSRAPVWWQWLKKEPTNILVIASIPPNHNMNPQSDPRYLTVAMRRSYILARTIYVLVEPERIIQVTKAKALKEENASEDGRTVREQWIETRRSR